MTDFITQITPLLEAIVNSPYTTLGGIFLSILGFSTTLYYRRKVSKYRHLGCVMVSNNLIRDRQTLFPELSIAYQGVDVDSMTVTKVRIKNLGKQVIYKHDIAPKDPLRISVDPDSNARILDSGLIESSNEANNFQCQLRDQIVSLQFDFMEPNDKAYIQIIHTGENHRILQVSGTVIDSKKPFKRDDSLDEMYERSIFRFMKRKPYLTSILTLLVLAALNIILALWVSASLAVRGLCMTPALLLTWTVFRITMNRLRRAKATDDFSDDFVEELVRSSLFPKWPTKDA